MRTGRAESGTPRLLAAALFCAWAQALCLSLVGAGCGGSDDQVAPRKQRSPNYQTGGTSGGAGVGEAGAGSTGGAGAGVAGMGSGQGAGTGEPVAGTGVAGAMVVAGASGVGTSGSGGGMRVFDAGSDPNRNKVQAGALCARLSQILCAGEQFCCSAPGRERAACESETTTSCVDELFLDAISANDDSGFDAARAETAFVEIERLASTCDPNIADYGASTDGLMGIFRGTTDLGATCHPGSTDPARAAAKLASCSDIETVACMPRSALTWECEERGAAGGDCFTDINCDNGLYCPNPPPLEIGKLAACAPRKTSGTPCELPNECASLLCRGGMCVDPSQDAAYCPDQ